MPVTAGENRAPSWSVPSPTRLARTPRPIAVATNVTTGGAPLRTSASETTTVTAAAISNAMVRRPRTARMGIDDAPDQGGLRRDGAGFGLTGEGSREDATASRVGFEPTTKGLKVPCSAAELPAHGRRYHAHIEASGASVGGARRRGTPTGTPLAGDRCTEHGAVGDTVAREGRIA